MNEIKKSEIAESTAQQFEIISPQQVRMQVNAIQEMMKSVMVDNTHYGKIPGCGDKPTLLQPGAQKLCLMFQLAPSFDVEKTELGNGHREYTVTCSLVSKQSGMVQGQGIGSCSTMESKYRYRNVADYEITGEPIPKDSKERKAEYRRQGLGMKKVDGVWEWVRFLDSQKSENPDIADAYNTVLKMANKRALVAATLNVTAASDIFTQDIEDMPQSMFNPVIKTVDSSRETVEAVVEVVDKSLKDEYAEAYQNAIKAGIKKEGIKSWFEMVFGHEMSGLVDAEMEQTIEWLNNQTNTINDLRA